MIFNWVLPLIFWSVLTICGLYSYRHGGPLERRVFAVILLLMLIQLLLHLAVPATFTSAELVTLIPDMALAAYLVLVALTTDRFWPLWAAALQTIAVLTHLAAIAAPDMMPAAYALTQGLWLYGVLIALMLGVRSVKMGQVRPVDGRASPS